RARPGHGRRQAVARPPGRAMAASVGRCGRLGARTAQRIIARLTRRRGSRRAAGHDTRLPHLTMATHLDLQEQEQVDALKAFWAQYGNLITWALVAALLVYAGITGWQWWQREQSQNAGAMFDEFERAMTAGDV